MYNHFAEVQDGYFFCHNMSNVHKKRSENM